MIYTSDHNKRKENNRAESICKWTSMMSDHSWFVAVSGIRKENWGKCKGSTSLVGESNFQGKTIIEGETEETTVGDNQLIRCLKLMYSDADKIRVIKCREVWVVKDQDFSNHSICLKSNTFQETESAE